MKTFDCTHCGHLVFFENVRCGHCGSTLGYLPGARAMMAFAPRPDGLWARLGARPGRPCRPCGNYVGANVCNWMLDPDDDEPLCRSCRYTEVIPQLGAAENARSWYLLEAAKRRLIYTLDALGLAIPGRAQDPGRGLVFHFLESTDSDGEVLTGHDTGLITLNIAEADDAEREARRTAMGEPYRTLLGHFRHEIGHFYWEQLIADGPWLAPFRALFGDETTDYGAALQHHYQNGAPADWADRFISSYASAHPWEDWAETWAHYLHIVDALDTAQHWGVSLAHRHAATTARAPAAGGEAFADILTRRWLPLSQFINSMNRSLGQRDSYPFVIADPVIAKLDFVHRLVLASRSGDWPPAVPAD